MQFFGGGRKNVHCVIRDTKDNDEDMASSVKTEASHLLSIN